MKTRTSTSRRARLRAGVTLGWLSLLALGCSSTRTAPIGEPLPFHVAMVPTEVVRTATPVDPDDMQLLFDSTEISEVLRSTLEGKGFARVSLLGRDDSQVGVVSASTSALEDPYWKDLAYDLNADLVMTSKLVYDPLIEGRRNEKFWLNLPLFLLGGPFCYFINDRTYDAHAELQVEFCDLTNLHEELGPRWSLLTLPMRVEFNGTTLDFKERAENVGSYGLSLLVPAGLLSRDTERVQGKTKEAALERIGEDLLVKVHAASAEIQRNEKLGAFRVDTAAAQVVRAQDGSVSLSLPLQGLGPNRTPRGYTILVDGQELSAGVLEDGASAQEGHWIRENLTVSPDAGYLQVRIEDAVGGERSYTFPIGL